MTILLGAVKNNMKKYESINGYTEERENRYY